MKFTLIPILLSGLMITGASAAAKFSAVLVDDKPIETIDHVRVPMLSDSGIVASDIGRVLRIGQPGKMVEVLSDRNPPGIPGGALQQHSLIGINPAGMAVVTGLIAGDGRGDPGGNGVWYVKDGKAHLLARSGASIPGGEIPAKGVNVWPPLDDGRLVLRAMYSTGMFDYVGTVDHPDDWQSVDMTKRRTPAKSTQLVCVTPGGKFLMLQDDVSDPKNRTQSLWFGEPDHLVKRVATGDPAPGLTPEKPFSTMGMGWEPKAAANDAGTVVFVATVGPTTPDWSNPSTYGIWQVNADVKPTLLITDGQSVEGLPEDGKVHGLTTAPQLTENGDVFLNTSTGTMGKLQDCILQIRQGKVTPIVVQSPGKPFKGVSYLGRPTGTPALENYDIAMYSPAIDRHGVWTVAGANSKDGSSAVLQYSAVAPAGWKVLIAVHDEVNLGGKPAAVRSIEWAGKANKSGQFPVIGKIGDDVNRLYLVAAQ